MNIIASSAMGFQWLRAVVLVVGTADESFGRVLFKTLSIAVIAFVVSSLMLVALWKSLARESKEGALHFTPESRRKMIWLILTLIGFGLIFGWMAFNAP